MVSNVLFLPELWNGIILTVMVCVMWLQKKVLGIQIGEQRKKFSAFIIFYLNNTSN